MIVYRYELEDGGGPFYYLNGTPRNKNAPIFNDTSFLYGADSKKNLDMLFENYDIDINKLKLKIYDANILNYNKRNGHICFEKEGAILLNTPVL